MAEGRKVSTVFSTPEKLPSPSLPSSIPSVTDIERGLQGVKLGSGSPLIKGGSVDELEATPSSKPNTTLPCTPGSTSTRSPTPMISLTPFKRNDTPLKRRAVLQSRTKEASVIEGARNWQISIEDPLELQHDLGSVIRSIIGQSYIRAELRRAIVVLRCALEAQDLPFNATCKDQGEELTNLLKASGGSILEALCIKSDHVPHLPFSCNVCGQEGHREKECPFFVCRKCGKQGHYARNCTEAPSLKRENRRRGGKKGNDRRKSGGEEEEEKEDGDKSIRVGNAKVATKMHQLSANSQLDTNRLKLTSALTNYH